jgi:hypothetical protein
MRFEGDFPLSDRVSEAKDGEGEEEVDGKGVQLQLICNNIASAMGVGWRVTRGTNIPTSASEMLSYISQELFNPNSQEASDFLKSKRGELQEFLNKNDVSEEGENVELEEEFNLDAFNNFIGDHDDPQLEVVMKWFNQSYGNSNESQ